MGFSKTILFVFAFIFLGLKPAEKNDPIPVGNHLNYGIPVSQLVPSPYYKNRFSVLVQKSSYSLFLKYEGRIIKSYPCVFGLDPVGDKLQKGDKRTPEGQFRINGIRKNDLWAYFLSVDYPTADSRQKHEKAKYYGQIPKDAHIGGAIGFHGVADGLESWIDTRANWTDGCIALKNQDINELVRYLGSGTEVLIVY